MIETHPFGTFLPNRTYFLVTGTFPGRQFSQRTALENEQDVMAFSYGGRNHFWKIMSSLFETKLVTRRDKQALLETHHFGMIDLYYQVERKNASNLDSDLIIVATNKEKIAEVIANQSIKVIFCTGVGVSNTLKKWFPLYADKIKTLPSPSPAYRAMSLEKKIITYQNIFTEYGVFEG